MDDFNVEVVLKLSNYRSLKVLHASNESLKMSPQFYIVIQLLYIASHSLQGLNTLMFDVIFIFPPSIGGYICIVLENIYLC